MKNLDFITDSPTPMIVTDLSSKITQINSSALKLFSYEKEELLNEYIEVLIQPEKRENHVKLRENIHNDRSFMMTSRIVNGLKKTGELVKVKVSLNYIKRENPQILIILSDYTTIVGQENILLEKIAKARSHGHFAVTDFIKNHQLLEPLSNLISLKEAYLEKHDMNLLNRFFNEIDKLEFVKKEIDITSNKEELLLFDTLLIVDDAQAIHDLFRISLEGKLPSDKVQYAYNGKEALGLINTQEKDKKTYIILDLNMPVMNGFEFLEQTKGLESIEILILSSTEDNDEIDKGLSYTTVGRFCKKPIKISEIRKRIIPKIRTNN